MEENTVLTAIKHHGCKAFDDFLLDDLLSLVKACFSDFDDTYVIDVDSEDDGWFTGGLFMQNDKVLHVNLYTYDDYLSVSKQMQIVANEVYEFTKQSLIVSIFTSNDVIKGK